MNPPGRQKGTPKTGGRQKGTPNRATREFRDTVRSLLESNADNVAIWLAAVAEGNAEHDVKPDPGRALDLLGKLAEYASPKLSRAEVSGANGGPIEAAVSLVVNGVPNRG